jgi:hypothetical protein
MGLRSQKRQEADRKAAERLERAQQAGAEIDGAASTAESQVSLVHKLMNGWREVHRRNHLAELFREEYGGIRE